MSTVHPKSKVTLSYVGYLDNGESFVVVDEKSPHSFTMGQLEMPPTLENGIIGLKEGDEKKIRVPPEEGYGHRQKILLHSLSRKSFGNKVAPRPGMILSLKIERDGKEHQVPATVMEVTNESVLVDYNHPLAGHHLTYHITVLKIDNNI